MSDEPETERSSDGHFASDWMDYLGMLNQYCNPLYLLWAKGTQEGMWDEFLAVVDFEKGNDGNYHVNTKKTVMLERGASGQRGYFWKYVKDGKDEQQSVRGK